MLRTCIAVCWVLPFVASLCAGEAPVAAEVEALRQQVEALMKADAEKDRKIEKLQNLANGMVTASKPLPAETVLDRALSQLAPLTAFFQALHS